VRKSRNEGPEVFKKKENMVLEGVSSLGGALITLFILWGSIIGLAGVTFCFECRRIIWESLITICKRVLKGLKMLTRKRKFVKFKRHRKVHVQSMQKVGRPK
jgi:hypothetical protein